MHLINPLTIFLKKEKEKKESISINSLLAKTYI